MIPILQMKTVTRGVGDLLQSARLLSDREVRAAGTPESEKTRGAAVLFNCFAASLADLEPLASPTSEATALRQWEISSRT